MESKRIVITGIGILSSSGIGKDSFWDALKKGKSGVKPVTLFDVSGLKSKLAGEITNFKAEEILGEKGLRNLDRSTKLILSAAQLALTDAGIKYPINEAETNQFGVSLGSTMGSVASISEFDKQGLREGPRSVNPAAFPNTVINSPASQVSIRFNIKGFNTTISTGFSASVDAIGYALDLMNLYDYDVVLSGGVEELCIQTYLGFYKIGHLSGSREGKIELNCPFDKRRNGIVFGEGAGMVVMEELEHAKKRNACIYGEILGYGTCFDPKSRNRYNPRADGAGRAIKLALADAKANTADINYICASANSTLDCDVMETRSISAVFNSYAKNIPVSSIKSMAGDTFSAAGIFNTIASLGAINEGFIPPTINYEIKDTRCDLDYVPNEARPAKVKTVLVNAFTPTGVNSSLVVGKV